MESTHDTHEEFTPDEGIPTDRRPLGFWLRLVDAKLSEAFDAEFGEEGFDRRAWMVLNLLAGDADDERLERLTKIARKRGGRLMQHLEESGWIVPDGDGWALTDAGRAQRDAVKTRIDAIRARVLEAVPAEEYTALVGSLQKIAREFGWDGSERMPRGLGSGRGWARGRGRRAGFGRGFGPGFGPGEGPRPGFGRAYEHGFGEGRGFGHEHEHGFGDGHGHERGFGDGHEHEHRFGAGHRFAHAGIGPDAHCAGHAHAEHASGAHGHGHRHGHGGRKAERAYERGFEAGVAAASRVTTPSHD